METLNDLYLKSCKPDCKSYKKISNNITLIHNFFENFEAARDFFINREKWKCIPYQGHSNTGYESLFLSWIGRSLMEKYVLDNKISDDINSYNIKCTFLYDDHLIWNLSHSNYFPHIDAVEKNDVSRQICLINLNKVSVSTKFYTYKNKEYCASQIVDEWNEYDKKINFKLKDYYNKNNITRNEVKLFLDNQKLETQLVRTIEYKPNQAIVYSSNLFHSPNVTQEFTEDNPRCLLRIMFDKKIVTTKNIRYD
jgi:hypothetical protein